MSRLDPRLFFGLLLIGGGVLFLLQEFGFIPRDLGWLWGLVFGLAGLAFLTAFVLDRGQWWALIPGFILLSLALLILLGETVPSLAGQWGGTIFLGGLALPFLLIYLINRTHWWGLIPGGVLATLAVVAGVSENMNGFAVGGLFFLGLGLTFLVIWFAPTPQGRMGWAIFPAIPLLILGLLLITPFASLAGFVWPVVLMLAGAYLLFRAFRPRWG
jgi:hypothetical protein